MLGFLLLLIVIGIIFYFRLTAKKDCATKDLPVKDFSMKDNIPLLARDIFSKNEQKFFFCFLEIIRQNPNYQILSKVRWGDIWESDKKLLKTNRSEYFRYHGYIKSRHIDFVLIYTERGKNSRSKVVLLIELQDKTHYIYKDTITRDKRLRSFCEATNLKLLEIDTRNFYNQQDIVNKVNDCLSGDTLLNRLTN